MKTALRIAAGIGCAALVLAGCSNDDQPAASGDTTGSAATDFPTDTIEMVVAYAPGGPTDAGARVLAKGMEEALGVSVVVVNKEGAAGALGTGEAAEAKPDGYTILFTSSGPFLQTSVKSDLPYALDDFVDVGGVAEIPYLVLVSADTEWETVDDLEASGDGLKYATPGVGTTPHVILAAFLDKLGVEGTNVPFDGDSVALQALLGGQVDMAAVSPQAAMQYLDNGQLRVLAQKATSPLEGIDADVPTFADLDVDEDTFAPRMAVVAPDGTPDDVLEILRDALSQAATSPEMDEFLATSGWARFDDDITTDWVETVQGESERYGEVMTRLGIAG